MRSTPEPTERALPPLGAPIRQQQPEPAPVQVAPGVVRRPDGTLETQLPDPQPLWLCGPRHSRWPA